MYSESHRIQDHNVSDFEAKPPMFFKIILENTVREGKLEIPPAFVRNYGNCLRSPIILKVPNGKTWQVELSNVNVEVVWLVKGWQEFVEHYSLKHGNLLVFKYEGNSHFNVLIFDTSALEIDYAGCAIHSEHSDWQVQEFQGNLATSSRVVGGHKTSADFSSSKPWFKVVLKSIHVQQKYLNLPFSFVQKHMALKAKTAMLKVGDRSWAVKLNVYPHKKTAAFHGGMPSFLRENSLVEGDVCVFELMSSITLNVSIFRR